MTVTYALVRKISVMYCSIVIIADVVDPTGRKANWSKSSGDNGPFMKGRYRYVRTSFIHDEPGQRSDSRQQDDGRGDRGSGKDDCGFPKCSNV